MLDVVKVNVATPCPAFFGDGFLLLRVSARKIARVPSSVCHPFVSSSLIFLNFLVIVFYCSELAPGR